MVDTLLFCLIYSYLFIGCQSKALPPAVMSVLQGNNPFLAVPCDFENGLCTGYETQDKSASNKWLWQKGRTPSINTGPTKDHTPGYNGNGYYVYIESSDHLNGDVARLETKPLDASQTAGKKLCLSFYYHMRGNTMGELTVHIMTFNNKAKNLKFRLKGKQGDNDWKEGRFMFDTPRSTYKIIFQGKTSYSYYGDIGLDDINLSAKTCDFWPTKAMPIPKPTPVLVPIRNPENQTTCGRSSIQMGKIIGATGVTVPIGKWPWMAMLQRLKSDGTYGQYCGGTLLSNKWIITAAHCVVHIPRQRDIRVRLGGIKRKANERSKQDYFVKNVYVHPEYKTVVSFHKDIALLELERPAIINNFVESVCLLKDQQPLGGTKCIIAGWGKMWHDGNLTEEQSMAYPNELLEAEVTIEEHDVCKSKYSQLVTDHMLCAHGYDDISDTCTGDSGGPLMCENNDKSWSLVGITSWGHRDGCGSIGNYGVYSKMHKLNDWVKMTISNPSTVETLF